MEAKVTFTRFGAHVDGMKSKAIYVPVLHVVGRDFGEHVQYPIGRPDVDITRKNYVGTIQLGDDFVVVATDARLYSFDVSDGSLIAGKEWSALCEAQEGLERDDEGQLVLIDGGVRKVLDRELHVSAASD